MDKKRRRKRPRSTRWNARSVQDWLARLDALNDNSFMAGGRKQPRAPRRVVFQ